MSGGDAYIVVVALLVLIVVGLTGAVMGLESKIKRLSSIDLIFEINGRAVVDVSVPSLACSVREHGGEYMLMGGPGCTLKVISE